MSTYALIPGGGGDPWEWHRLAPELEARGHEALAIRLPSEDDSAGWTEYAEAVVEALGDRRAPGPGSGTAHREAISGIEVRVLRRPEAVVSYPLGENQQVRLAGTVVSRIVLQPGWSWREHAQPMAREPWARKSA